MSPNACIVLGILNSFILQRCSYQSVRLLKSGPCLIKFVSISQEEEELQKIIVHSENVYQ